MNAGTEVPGLTPWGAPGLPWAPLDERVRHELARRGRHYSAREAGRLLGVAQRTWTRWKAAGALSIDSADRAACALGLHPSSVWPRAWYALPVPDPEAILHTTTEHHLEDTCTTRSAPATDACAAVAS